MGKSKSNIFSIDLDWIKENVNLIEYARTHYGIGCNSKGYARCPFCKDKEDKNPSFQIWQHNGKWGWTDWHFGEGHPGFTGTIVDLVMKIENKTNEEACKKLLEEHNPEESIKRETGKRTEYIYKDLKGKEIFKKVKIKDDSGKKTFFFEYKTEDGWKPGTGDNKLIPYNLYELHKYTRAIICEGEKDADNVKRVVEELKEDYWVTSAPTGKGSWPDSITKYFKHLAETSLLYDIGAEEDARKHAAKLQIAFPNMIINIAKVPLDKYGADITDYFDQESDKKKAFLYIMAHLEKFEVLDKSITTTPKSKIKPRKGLIINNEFLEIYIDSISRVTDAPKIFILFSGIALLSGILNKFYFMYPDRTQLNLYILLLAPSTYYRKTTIIEIAGKYLDDVNPSLQIPESFTIEALYEIVKKYPRGLIRWRELIQIKEFQMKSEYNKGLPAFLTDIYDYKKTWKRWTKNEGEITMEEPIISILAGGVTSWFVKNLSELDFQGGLWTRFLFVPVPEEERRFHLPGREVINPAITNPLKKLDEQEAKEINLSEILPLMETWGAEHQEKCLSLDSGILQAMYQRLEVMLLKLAALLQLSHDHSTTVTPESFNEAVKIIEYIKQLLPAFFKEEIQFTDFDKAKARVRKLIKKKGEIARGKLLQGANVSAEIATKVVGQLEEEGDIKILEFRPEGGGKKGQMYEWIGEEE